MRSSARAVEPLLFLGSDLLALQRPREAIAPLERALLVASRSDTHREDAGLVRFALARALWDSGGDKARARTLAGEARGDLLPLADRYSSYYLAELRGIEAWASAHRPSGIATTRQGRVSPR
jgi:hypothetical protein